MKSRPYKHQNFYSSITNTSIFNDLASSPVHITTASSFATDDKLCPSTGLLLPRPIKQYPPPKPCWPHPWVQLGTTDQRLTYLYDQTFSAGNLVAPKQFLRSRYLEDIKLCCWNSRLFTFNPVRNCQNSSSPKYRAPTDIDKAHCTSSLKLACPNADKFILRKPGNASLPVAEKGGRQNIWSSVSTGHGSHAPLREICVG